MRISDSRNKSFVVQAWDRIGKEWKDILAAGTTRKGGTVGAMRAQSQKRYKDPAPHRHNPRSPSPELLLGRMPSSFVHEVLVPPYPLPVSIAIRWFNQFLIPDVLIMFTS